MVKGRYCNFCEKIITDKKEYLQVEVRKRNNLARGRINGIFETYLLHKKCADDVFRMMKIFTPEELDGKDKDGNPRGQREDEEKRLKCSKGACE